MSTFDWSTWLTALGIGDLKPSGSLRFSQYDQLINAAIGGQGVALGRIPLLQDAIRSGALVAPFEKTVSGTRGYFVILSKAGHAKPYADDFCNWLRTEAAAEKLD